LPGLLGGFVSAIVAAVYVHPSTLDAYTPSLTDFPQLKTLINSPYKQGGLQIAAIFCSIGIALVTAVITGLALRLIYNWNEN
jgi:cell division protein FtsX